MDMTILKILKSCNCLDYYEYFGNVTMSELESLTLKQLRLKLKSLLPSTEEGKSSAEKIIIALAEFNDDQVDQVDQHQDQVDSANSQQQQKQENDYWDNSILLTPGPQSVEQEEENDQDDDEDEVKVIKVIEGDVSLVEVKVKEECPIVLVDDELSEEDENPIISQLDTPSSTRADEPEEISPTTSNNSRTNSETYFIFKPTSQLIKKLRVHPTPRILISGPEMNKIRRKRKAANSISSPDMARPNSSYTWAEWNRLYNNCNRVHEIICTEWTWKPIDQKSPNNLFLLLSKIPNVNELSIQGNCTESSNFSEKFSLPNLKTLKIFSPQFPLINYVSQLGCIIEAANGQLMEIVLQYGDDIELNDFLDLLLGLDKNYLKGLNSLTIMRSVDEAVAMTRIELDKLSRIEADGLEYLFLRFGIWDDCQEQFEAMLRRFSNLKELMIEGCFFTQAPEEPKIVINFPALPHLEYLEMGRSYRFTSIFESIHSRPHKKRDKHFVRIEDDGSSRAKRPKLNFATEENGECFSVTLNLPYFPKLVCLKLGKMYEIEDLHFSRMPNLTCFMVSSPWHLSVTFPTESSRRITYPAVTEFQLPDGLQDHTFVTKIPIHFPNIESCFMNLCSVKVLRAFAKVMKPMTSLKQLELELQYDFPSSLNACMLDKPSSQSPPPCQEELEKIRILKEYKFWNEYVQLHQIEVPDSEVLIDLENEEEFSGLCSLNEKFQEEKSFIIWHVPRTLRLPKGELHWNDDDCQFSDTLIGFENYPYPKEAWNQGPLGIFANRFDLSAVPHRMLKAEQKSSFFEIDSSMQGTTSKKEERHDPS